MSYFLIHNDEDGDVSVCQIDARTFLKDLAGGYYGSDVQFIDTIPSNPDVQSWGSKGFFLLIKGEIVVPKPKTVVQEYTLE